MLLVLTTLYIWMLPLKLTPDRTPQVIPAGAFLHSKEPKWIFPVFTNENVPIATAIPWQSHLNHTNMFLMSLKY